MEQSPTYSSGLLQFLLLGGHGWWVVFSHECRMGSGRGGGGDNRRQREPHFLGDEIISPRRINPFLSLAHSAGIFLCKLLGQFAMLRGVAKAPPNPTHRGVTKWCSLQRWKRVLEFGCGANEHRVSNWYSTLRTGLVTDTALCAPAPELVGKRPSLMTLSTGWGEVHAGPVISLHTVYFPYSTYHNQ